MSAATPDILLSELSEGILTLTLNRPERLNAMSHALLDAVVAALDAADQNDAVKAVIFTGAGRGFCAGTDRSGGPETFRNARVGSVEEHRDIGGVLTLRIFNMRKPVIAAINGPAVGAGCGLALAADIRLMSDAALISTGYLKIGLSPDAGVSYFLPRLIGLARATELLLTSRDLPAAEAERMGLVARVLPATQFQQEVSDYANRLAAGPPVALTLTKRLLRDSLDSTLLPQLRDELQGIMQCLKSRDAHEAFAAFREKRRPTFEGK